MQSIISQFTGRICRCQKGLKRDIFEIMVEEIKEENGINEKQRQNRFLWQTLGYVCSICLTFFNNVSYIVRYFNNCAIHHNNQS